MFHQPFPGPAVLAILFAVLLAACQPADPASMVTEARQARERGDTRAAVILLKNAIQRDANYRAARVLLGEMYLDRGEPQSAEKELRRALALGADGGKLTLLLGKALLMQGQYQKVLDEIDPRDAPAQRPATIALRANALLGQGHVEEARKLFSSALELAADAPEPLLGLARIAVWEKQHERAHGLVQRALAVHPGDIDCLRFQADLLRAQGKLERALSVQQSILTRYPHNAQALVDLANLHIDAGRIATARASLAAARRVAGPSVGLMYSEAMLAFRENKLADALETAQRVLRVAPDHYPSILLAGAIQSAQGAHQQATQHLQKFLLTYPGHPYASKLLVSIHLAANNPQAALAVLRPLLTGQGSDVELLALAGEAHLRARQFDEATALFERASALQPGAATLHTGLALSRMGNGDSARAVTELERAATLERDPARTGMLLVMGYLRANMPDKAMAAVREMEKRGDNPLIQNLKGGIFLARADARGARASFERALVFDPAYLPSLTNLERLDALEQRGADTVKRYLAALDKSPRNSALMEALARLELAANHRTEAVAWTERARAAQPDSLPLALRAASLFLRAGETKKALLLAQQLQTSHPADPAVTALLAQASVAAGKYAEAADAYARLAALSPGSGRPHLHLAAVRIAQKQNGAALNALQKALSIEPDLLDARITLINLLLKQGKPAEAMAAASALKQRQPEHAAGYKLEGDVLSMQGKHAAALQAYEQAFAKTPSGPALIQMTGALNRLGREAEADARIAQWFKRHPGDVPTRLHVASTKLIKNEPKAAIAHLESVLKVDPRNLAALNDLAWSYQRIGDAQALALAQRAHAQAPDNPAIMDTLGWIHLERGDLARAMPLLQRASALAPNSAEIHYHFGMVLAKSGDRRAARRELQKAVAAGAGFARREEAKALLQSL